MSKEPNGMMVELQILFSAHVENLQKRMGDNRNRKAQLSTVSTPISISIKTE